MITVASVKKAVRENNALAVLADKFVRTNASQELYQTGFALLQVAPIDTHKKIREELILTTILTKLLPTE